MSSTRRGMMNVLIAAVLWGSSGVCAQYIMEQSQMSSQFLTMTRLIFAGLILLMLSFVHGDKVFSIIKNRKDAISLLESGKMNVAPPISHELGLEEVQDFLDGKIQGVSKAVVKVGE